MRFHGSDIGILHSHTTNTLCINLTNQVKVVTNIEVTRKVDSVSWQEAQINTDVQLMLLLISQLTIGNIGQLQAQFLIGI